jgi:hypothetical protein
MKKTLRNPKKFSWKIRVVPKQASGGPVAGKCGGGACSGGGKCNNS